MIPIVITFFAILALIALIGAGLLVISRTTRVQLGPHAVNLAWLVAAVATLGSLFLSEVAGFIPCALCWVQRGFMYPLAVLLAIPQVRASFLRWVPWWALAGGAVSVYHYLEQRLPSLPASDFCDPAVPCSTIWVKEFGFVTIPFMALCGFLAIAALIWTRLHYQSDHPSSIGVAV